LLSWWVGWALVADPLIRNEAANEWGTEWWRQQATAKANAGVSPLRIAIRLRCFGRDDVLGGEILIYLLKT